MKYLQFPLLILIITISACKTEKVAPQDHWLQVGNAHYAACEFTLALEAWQKALDIQPSNLDLYRKIGQVYFNQAKYSNALSVYNKLLQRQPKDWNTWLQVAKIQLQLLNISAAENSYNKCRNKLVTTASLIFAGDLLAAKNDFVGAEQKYRQALVLDEKCQAAMARMAICLFGQHHETNAEQSFQKLVDLSPNTTEILVQMSHYQLLKGNNEQAKSYLLEAVDHDPENIDLQIKLAEFYFETGKGKESISVLDNILAQSPENCFARKVLAETLLTNRQFKKAKILLNSITETEQKDVDFLLLNGKLALLSGEYNNATSFFQEALEQEPSMPIGHYFLAISYLACGMNNLGQKSLRKALELSPRFSNVELTLADSYYQSGDFELAMIHAKRVGEEEPGNFRAHLIMGNLYLAQNDLKQALIHYRSAQLLYPKSLTPYFGMAQATFAANELDATMKILQEHLKDTLPANAMKLYVKSLIREKKYHQAVEFINQEIQKNPENCYLHYILGEIQLKAGNRQEAIKAFKQVLKYNFATKAAFSKLFTLYQSDDEQLKKILLNAISKVHDFPEARIKMAKLYNTTGQTEKAIAILQEGLAITPDSPALDNNLAWLYSNHQPDKINEALRLAQLAYEQQPSNAAVADTLGWIYLKKNMLNRSEWMLEQARNLAPDNPEILQHYKILQKAIQCTPKPDGGAGGVVSTPDPPS